MQARQGFFDICLIEASMGDSIQQDLLPVPAASQGAVEMDRIEDSDLAWAMKIP